MTMQESYEMTRDNLFAASQMMPVVADKLTIAKVSGGLKRGAVVTEAGALVASTTEPYAVLAEDVDTTSAAKDAAVYLTGEFNANALIVGSDTTVPNIKAKARKVGIFIKAAA